jgi:hypothetical protein
VIPLFARRRVIPEIPVDVLAGSPAVRRRRDDMHEQYCIGRLRRTGSAARTPAG